MLDFKAKNPNSISAVAPPQISLGSLQRSPDLVTEFNGPTSKVLEENGGKRECDREGGGREKAETLRVGSHPMSEILMIAELIWAWAAT